MEVKSLLKKACAKPTHNFIHILHLVIQSLGSTKVGKNFQWFLLLICNYTINFSVAKTPQRETKIQVLGSVINFFVS